MRDMTELPARLPGARLARVAEVFLAFLRLGVTSFGGPVAHIGYFRAEFVTRRGWLTEASYADIVALCQFLPGPASSQVGFSVGLLRAGGVLGGLAAWLGFTMPSAMLLVGAAFWASAVSGWLAVGVLHGLKLVAVAVVGQAVWGMGRTLTPDWQRLGVALVALGMVVLAGGAGGQVGAIAMGALAGLWLCRGGATPPGMALSVPVAHSQAIFALGLFVLLLVLPDFGTGALHQGLSLFSAFYRSGALVFGGGHVVLPLLQAAVVRPGWVGNNSFIAGYGLAQAVPGPLFTFAAYLGAVINRPPGGVLGAAIALVGIFLPGLLLVYGVLPFWSGLRRRTLAQAGMRGANAAVVGILAAAFYNPVWTHAVSSPVDAALAGAGFLLLTIGKAAPWVVVIMLAVAGALQSFLWYA